MKKARTAISLFVLAGTVLGVVVAEAVTFTNETSALTFPSPNLTSYSPGFSWSTQHGDMALDSDGNPHLIHANNPGHLGTVEYRRFTHATTNWSGASVKFVNGDGTFDSQYAYIMIDDADRVHVLYQHRTNAEPWKIYHAWCTNATGTTPLSLGNWNGPTNVTAISVIAQSGSLISVGSNLLLFAVGKTDATGDGNYDIRIDRADWNGSSWVWSQMGVAVSNAVGNQYGGFHTPILSYDATNDVLHLAYRDESGFGVPRAQAYAQSSQPTNPVLASWTSSVRHGGINTQWKEGNGGTGILRDGRAVAIVYLGGNRDNMNLNGAPVNWTRVREAGVAGTWSNWEIAFTNDYRSLGGNGNLNTGYGGFVAFAPDGAGGLFMIPPGGYVSHWDPATTNWTDVFTNFPSTFNNYPVGNIGIVVAAPEELSTLYYFRRGTDMLYRGTYIIKPGPPRGMVITIR